MKKYLGLLLAFILVLSPVSAFAEDDMYEGYKVEETEITYELDNEEVDLNAYMVSNWDTTGEKPSESRQVVVKLRDVAATLKDSDSKFSISYDEEKGAVQIKTGEDYEVLEDDLTELDLENLAVRASTDLVYVDGEAVAMTGVLINGYNYYRLSVIRNTIGNFRFNSDFEDSNKSYLFTNESDLALFDQEDFEAKLKDAEYTIVYNWGPWCYYSRRSIPKMEELVKFYEENDIDAQVIGIVNQYYNFTNEEVNPLFTNGESVFENFGATDEAYEYLQKIYGDRIGFFPLRFIVDKDGNMVGNEFFDYYDEITKEYLEGLEEEKTEDDLTDEEWDIIEDKTYEEFLKRALED